MTFIKELAPFFEYVRKKAVMPDNTINNLDAAAKAVAKVLDESELTIDYVMNNAEVIRNRLQHSSTDISGSTIALYIQRTQLAIRNYLQWREDREAWEKTQAGKSSKSARASKTEIKKPISVNSAKQAFRNVSIPTGDGNGNFNVTLPENFMMDDLLRLAWGLAIYTADFDPAEMIDKFRKPHSSKSSTSTEVDILN